MSQYRDKMCLSLSYSYPPMAPTVRISLLENDKNCCQISSLCVLM